jgi:hypothetical protein
VKGEIRPRRDSRMISLVGEVKAYKDMISSIVALSKKIVILLAIYYFIYFSTKQ